ncbi:MAG: hypothetical protein ACTH2U_11140 [Brevibacterium sp.]
MEQNIDQTEILKALYQDYLSENVQLKEERAALRLRVAELEAALKEGEHTESQEDDE